MRNCIDTYGAVFDNPDLIAACVVGDGDAETGPLATAGRPFLWMGKQLLNDKLVEHKQYITQNGEDMPEIHNWVWVV